MKDDKNFVAPDRIQVIIPYSDLEKMANMAHEMEEMKKQYNRLCEMYSAIYGMFSECLEKIAEIRDFVKDS